MTTKYVMVKRYDLVNWANDWAAENDPGDDTDVVTPFDGYLLNGSEAQPVANGVVQRHVVTKFSDGSTRVEEISTAPSAPVGVVGHVKALRELRDTGDVSDWRLFESALDAAIAALAQQLAATLPDVDDDDLTVAYMAGRHDGRKEAQQPAADRVCPNTLQTCRCDKYAPCAAQQPAAVDEAWLVKARELYDRCSLFPEKTADGLMALLELRNHVHSILDAQKGGPQE